MQGKLVPVKLPPGMFRNGTRYQASGRWYDGNLVRFIDGTIRPIGGWRRYQSSAGGDLDSLTGVARAALGWRSENGALVRVAVGTHSKLYAVVQGAVFDITPSDLVAGAQDSSISAGTGAYGDGDYGAGPYGTGSSASTLLDADTWQLDTFGDFLVGVLTSDGRLLYWDTNTANDAVEATDAPVNNRGVVVTPERHLVALGADGNVRLVKWATQEGGISVSGDWTASASTTAGEWPLQTKGRIIAGRRTKKETLIWTDADLWRMTWIGGTLVYAFDQAGDACGLLAPNAMSIIESRAFWMGRDNFFVYDGFVQPLPSEVRDYVFGDINRSQLAKIWSMTVAKYGEIWWFYPSGGSDEIDRAVVYNYLERHWTTHMLPRTAGFDAGANQNPTMLALAYAAKGTLTSDEVNVSDGDTVTIGAKTYTFEATLTDVDGNVQIGADAEESLANLHAAINLGAGAGTAYADSMTLHPTVQAEDLTATTLVVRAKASGTAGNSLAATEDSDHLTWGVGVTTLAGGGAATGYVVSDLFEHETADDRGSEVPYLESGPFELSEGDRFINLHGLIPDENTIGDVQLTFYSAFYPTDAETTHGPFSMAAPTDLRITARQLRMRLDQAVETDWRFGVPRGAVTPGSRR